MVIQIGLLLLVRSLSKRDIAERYFFMLHMPEIYLIRKYPIIVLGIFYLFLSIFTSQNNHLILMRRLLDD
ncbi:hypothetical protein D9O50_04720 [Oxalobacteraceae bacterium CAVE-383]|nr:hypothetical protein D9O50_04720 [Oxalobacteraceae bacterium CAVE-383]